MFEHLLWANEQILAILQNSEDKMNEEKRLFSHILLTEEVWLNRIIGLENQASLIWTELGIEECSKLINQNKQKYEQFIASLPDQHANKLITYKNSNGQEFTTSIKDILTHIALHGHYHRGQINQKLRLDGFEPVGTDFITFVR
jgi:uncharacterized damage-inducible protein DinB